MKEDSISMQIIKGVAWVIVFPMIVVLFLTWPFKSIRKKAEETFFAATSWFIGILCNALALGIEVVFASRYSWAQ